MKTSKARKILVIAPHPDDEVLGCGGALCRHRAAGDRVSVIFLTSGELGLKELPLQRAKWVREREARAAARILGVTSLEFLHAPDWGVAEAQADLAAPLRRTLRRERPDVVYLPHPADGHPDHQAVWPLLCAAWGKSKPAAELRAYEVWTPLGAYDHVEDISTVMERKVRALRAHASQLREFDYLRAIRGLNQYRGVLAARRPYAEVFQTLTLA